MTNISGSKSNQAMKLSQVIEYNLRNIFLQKSYTKCGAGTIPRPFLKQNQNFIHFVFVWQVEDYQN